METSGKPVRPVPAPLTEEEYQAIKAKYPDLTFYDEDKTFLSRAGNITKAAVLRRIRPMTPEQMAMGPVMRTQKKKNQYDQYLALIAKGWRITAAAEKVGLTYTGVRNRRVQDPDFAEAEKQAEQQAAEPIEDSLYQAALSGNVPAAVKWLEKRAAQRWPGDKIQIESNQTIELDATDHLKNIALLMARLQQRQQYLDVEAYEPAELSPPE